MEQRHTFTGMYSDLGRLRFGSLVHRLLADSDAASEQRRERLDALIARADERGWLDIESLGRLRAGDDAVVLSILDELAIATWLEFAGYELVFNPPGAAGRIGELLLRGPAGELWLEVKTLLPAGSVVVAQTTQALLEALAATIAVPARLTLEITHHPQGGIGRRELRRYLETAALQLLAGAPPPAAYTHAAGLYVRAMGCEALAGAATLQVTFSADPWPGEQALALRLWHERLWRALRGGYSQLPHSGPPTLIIVVDHTNPAPAMQHWLDPLSELLRMGQHRYLSAIGRLRSDDLWEREPELTVFLNPRSLAAFPEVPLAALEQRVCLLTPSGVAVEQGVFLMPRITKVYTRTGDAGSTGLGGGQRVPKDSLRVAAYGTVDELNAQLGVARATGLAERSEAALRAVQNELFHLGSDLCILEEDKQRFAVPRIEQRHVDALEAVMDGLSEELGPLENFILPGGTLGSAQLHVARTVCRRAERDVIALTREEQVGAYVVPYLNRLSDALFVLARYENHAAGVADVLWDSRA